MSIFDKRVAFKPFEYPEIIKFKEAINNSYWLVSEWNFTSDVQDFNVILNDREQSAIKNTLLAISQIEVAVKKFWTKLGDRFPKPEFEMVGVTCGESEVRHADAYSHLLQVLNLNDDFASLLTVPAIQGRVEYLNKYLSQADNHNLNYTLTLTLFSIFIENISLFSQFVIIQSFNKYLNVLKDIDNVVQATQKEELIHALLGVYIINQIKNEYPKWFNEAFYNKIYEASNKAYAAECGIIDWIFEQGELSFLSKATLKEFIKNRFNESIAMIGGDKVFTINNKDLEKLDWFNEGIIAEVQTDFFHKRPVAYSKRVQSIKEEDLF
jgi:ribonucleoside-diphosphate reductase beta chain